MDKPRASIRSACDRCRAKRVRCQPSPDSQAACARCARNGAVCVTGAPGFPGRPRKAPTHPSPGPLPSSTTSAAARGAHPVTSATPLAATACADDAGLPLFATELLSAAKSTDWFSEQVSADILDSMGVNAGLGLPCKPTAPKSASFLPGQHPAWTVPDGPRLFGCPFTDSQSQNASPALRSELLLSNPLAPQQQSPPGLVGPLGTFDMAYPSSSGGSDLFADVPDYTCLPSPASSLVRFRDRLDKTAAAMDVFLNDPANAIENCQEVIAANPHAAAEAMASETPVSLVLTSTKEFIDIVQSLNAGAVCISTETTLLVLSAYLLLMRLYDALFQNVLEKLGTVPLETAKSLKVKAVFRIGGMSTLQDMSGKDYALGIVSVIQSHIKSLERSLGLPPAYCLAHEQPVTGSSSLPPVSTGIFADEGRAKLLQTVMEQADVKRDNKLHVEWIRENIESSLAFFGD